MHEKLPKISRVQSAPTENWRYLIERKGKYIGAFLLLSTFEIEFSNFPFRANLYCHAEAFQLILRDMRVGVEVTTQRHIKFISTSSSNVEGKIDSHIDTLMTHL